MITNDIIQWYEEHGWPYARILQNGISRGVSSEQTKEAMVLVYADIVEREAQKKDIDWQQVIWRVWAEAKKIIINKSANEIRTIDALKRDIVELEAANAIRDGKIIDLESIIHGRDITILDFAKLLYRRTTWLWASNAAWIVISLGCVYLLYGGIK